MPVTPESATTALAYFKPLAGEDRGTSVAVHFNPESLQYTVTNTQDPKRKSGAGVQFVTQSTAKLTMDLVFDTTMTGVDVRVGSDQRIGTDKIAKLLRPYGPEGSQVPPSVEFGWGLYRFTGIVEQYKETLDFFSAGGVPLRSSVNITLSSNTVVFDSARNPTASVDSSITPEPVVLPGSAGPSPPVVGGAGAAGASSAASPSSVANTLRDPRAARGIASLSGSESLRFAGGPAAIVVAGGVNLSPPAGFSAGGGLRIGGAVGVGAGFGIAATSGPAFVGLHVGAHVSTSRGVTNPQALLPSPRVGSGGGFALGGAAHASAGGSLSADVGASADLGARIGFPD